MGIQSVSEPGEVYIQAADGGKTPFAIKYRRTVSGVGQGIRAVVIRICPTGSQGVLGPFKLVVRGIIMIRPPQLHEGNGTIFILEGIGLEETAFGRIIVRHECQAASHNMHVVVYQPPDNREQGVRLIQVADYIPFILCHGGFCELQHVFYLMRHGYHDHVGAQIHFFPKHAANTLILNDGNNFHHNSGNHYDAYTGNPAIGLILHDNPISNCKVMICF